MARLDWANFVQMVTSDFASGLSPDEINTKYLDHSIEGCGEVLRIHLGLDHDEYRLCFAQLRMPAVHFELPPDAYGSVNFIALDIDPDNAAHWSDVQTNDTIRFVTQLKSPDGPFAFPAIEISPRGDHGRRFDVRFGTEKSQLIQIVSHAEKSVLSIRLYAILPTQKPGQAYWYFDDRRLGDQERSALRAELREFEIMAPYEGSIHVAENCTLDVSFLGLDRDPNFKGGHATLRGYNDSVGDILWRLSRAADLMIDLSGHARIVTYPNRVDDFNRVSKTSLALNATDISTTLRKQLMADSN